MTRPNFAQSEIDAAVYYLARGRIVATADVANAIGKNVQRTGALLALLEERRVVRRKEQVHKYQIWEPRMEALHGVR